MESVDAQAKVAPGRVLIADDDEDLRILLAVHLRKCGYNVVEFADGEGLLDYVGTLMQRSSQQIMPDDRVILDVKMPGLSGLQILTSLRLAGWTNPIVVVTALRPQVDSEALRLGADAVIHKPCDPHEIIKVLAHLADFPREREATHLGNCSRHLFT